MTEWAAKSNIWVISHAGLSFWSQSLYLTLFELLYYSRKTVIKIYYKTEIRTSDDLIFGSNPRFYLIMKLCCHIRPLIVIYPQRSSFGYMGTGVACCWLCDSELSRRTSVTSTSGKRVSTNLCRAVKRRLACIHSFSHWNARSLIYLIIPTVGRQKPSLRVVDVAS